MESAYCIGMKAQNKREPLFACQECGKKFYTAASADRAAFGDNGCPRCGGSDIDIYVATDQHGQQYVSNAVY